MQCALHQTEVTGTWISWLKTDCIWLETVVSMYNTKNKAIEPIMNVVMALSVESDLRFLTP